MKVGIEELLAQTETLGIAVGTDGDDTGGVLGVEGRFEQGSEVRPGTGDQDDQFEHGTNPTGTRAT
ncbi:hypothetical protein QP157_05955 [Sphingomonas sp. LR61]|uniref:hypothetical protein n=1 Tax=Sphingomonas sp. LR61 TaxID=3050234 RepID=UPI002FE3E1DD